MLKKLHKTPVVFAVSLLKSKLHADISNDFNFNEDKISVKISIEFSFIPSVLKSLPFKINDSSD